MFSILASVLSMVKSYFLTGFIFSVLLFCIGLLIIAIDKICSKALYSGLWCNICPCMRESCFRTFLNTFFKILLIILMFCTIAISGIQISNIINDPNWTNFPSQCSNDGSTSCIRVTSSPSTSFNSESITTAYDRKFIMHNGLIDLKQ